MEVSMSTRKKSAYTALALGAGIVASITAQAHASVNKATTVQERIRVAKIAARNQNFMLKDRKGHTIRVAQSTGFTDK
jgi:hypothetical protein